MNTTCKPKVAVLLAAYNGEKYIKEQIESIIKQSNIDLSIYISIDKSTDKTFKICEELKKIYKNISIINKGEERFGSAGKNFYSLLKSVDFQTFDYIAFSDQDDIWKSEKIIRGIHVLEKEKASGYSSDVECFWNNGNKKNLIIKKSYPQKKYDFYFEPAGPGCTYIIKNNLAYSIKQKILENHPLPFHHDWFIYAFARSENYKWIIDDVANILYRQHETNQVGANHGLSQHIKRIKKLKSGIFKKEVKEIIQSINSKNNDLISLRNSVIKNPFLYRRRKKEALLLFLFALMNWI